MGERLDDEEGAMKEAHGTQESMMQDGQCRGRMIRWMMQIWVEEVAAVR
jgi:hypothetical protein